MNNKRYTMITYTDGKAIEHLHYLPYGEMQVDQRATSYAARYTFSAKEKDEETGYSYFGARYYNSDLSVWLSVDPMSDKYPNMSPYVYCADNPVKLVDPDGKDWYVPEGQSVPIYDKNVNRNSVPAGGTYVGRTANWFGQTEKDMQYYYHGDIKGNVTKQDMTVLITPDKENLIAFIAKDIFDFGKNVGKYSDDMSITSRGYVHYRTSKNRLYMGNQYESAKIVGKTVFGKICKKMPYINAAINIYEIVNSACKYGLNSREVYSTTGGVFGSIALGAAAGSFVGFGIPGAIVGGIVGGIVGDIIGREAGSELYDELKK